MIRNMDHFVDTLDKRKALVIILAILLCVYMSFTYIRLASQIIQIKNYQELYSLLQIPSIQDTYIARVVLECLALPVYNVLNILKALFVSIHFEDVLTLICMGVFAYKKGVQHQFIYRLLIGIQLIGFIICGCIASLALQSTTLQMGIDALHNIGILFLITNSISILLLFYVLKYALATYREALNYMIIEIKD